MPDRRYRLAVLASHPIQYQVPLWRYLAAHPAFDLTVYFYSRTGLDVFFNPSFGQEISWDIPLLKGYRHRFLRNYSPVPNVNTFWRAFHPSLAVELSPARYDAILIHGWYSLSNWLAFATAWARRLPVLLRADASLQTLRGGRNRLKRMVLPRLFHTLAGFLNIGTQNEIFYREMGVPPERIFFTPHAVDNEFFQQCPQNLRSRTANLRRKWAIPERAVVVLFVGKLTPRKRPQDLIETAQRLSSSEPAVVFVGDGPLGSVLEHTMQSYRLRNIFFVGFVNQSHLSDLYSLADVFVIPSEFEPWGLVLNEAMNFSLPVLASDAVSAATDLVEPGRNGWMYTAGDVAALARHLELLVRDAELRAQLGQRSAEIICRWSFREDADGILTALQSLARR